MPSEIEIKLAVRDLGKERSAIEGLGYRVRHPREHEFNILYDFTPPRLRVSGQIIRLRKYGDSAKLTFKGLIEGAPGRHKEREEIEVTLSDAASMSEILRRLGLQPLFRYEKFRTEYAQQDEDGVITVDETPIGHFLELEGPPEWIDRTAGLLGYAETDYITASYPKLYNDYCERTSTPPRDMLFDAKANI